MFLFNKGFIYSLARNCFNLILKVDCNTYHLKNEVTKNIIIIKNKSILCQISEQNKKLK